MTASPPRSPRRAPGLWGWLWRPVLVLLVAGALGWWMLGLPARERAELQAPAEAPTTRAPEPAPEPRAWRPRTVVEPAPGCAPRVQRRCVDGDAWWIDGCGVANEIAQDCGTAPCRAGACEPGPPGCGDIPILGRCENDVAVGCAAGRPFAVDCGARGQRCVPTEEGPVCKPPSEHACTPALEPPRCDGDELVACVEGERARLDCRSRGAICGRPPQGTAACLQLRAPVLPEGCDDPCGCPDDTRREEVCNGLDDDHDGFVDESGECPPLDLVFFVIVDEDGQGSYSFDEVEAELARLQRLFARDDDFGLVLRQAEVIRVAEPSWLELDGDDLSAMVNSPTISEQRPELYVPVILTDRIFVDGVPRPGLSTVPNGMCGGQRRVFEPQPGLGLVAVAKERWDTTLAHELGHFLGLCHTHADHPQEVIPIDPIRGDGGRVCVEPCVLEGDGLCDTPADPGPGPCVVSPECQPVCTDGSSPDPGNLMGYYPQCRHAFTAEQAMLMRRTLALRRAWHRCLIGDGCTCEIGSEASDGQCPEAMSCRRFQGDDGPYQRCTLDGPVVPGGVCTNGLECSLGAQCIGQPDADSRCVRPCNDGTPDCRCAEVGGVSHAICVNDLRRDDG